MQVILKQDLHPLGQKGQAVSVKPGYFRNFLQPRGLAVVGTKKLLVRAEEVNAKIRAEQEQLKKAAEKLRETLNSTTIVLKEKLTKKGTLFAKVSAKEISEALSSQAKVTVSTDQVKLKEAIKKTGNFEVNVRLEGGVTAQVKIVVEGIQE
jgi:large subunit ribosomal protein L9